MTWELVCIHDGIDKDQREFMPHYAIWDTVTSRFVEIAGEVAWDGYADLYSYYGEDPASVIRALSLFRFGEVMAVAARGVNVKKWGAK